MRVGHHVQECSKVLDVIVLSLGSSHLCTPHWSIHRLGDTWYVQLCV